MKSNIYNNREKTASIIRAEGEAEAAKLINDAVKSFGSGSIF
jgi:regulator of protease activity HflC (stomatin/prohibitin superfamily)